VTDPAATLTPELTAIRAAHAAGADYATALHLLAENPVFDAARFDAAMAHVYEGKPSEAADGLVSLVDLAEQPLDAGETLIGAGNCRYLERGAPLMNVAPSGTGKSHIAAQGAVLFACGEPAFGLPPTMPLRCLIVQAENPPNDARQIAANMLRGLDLGPKQRALVHTNTRQVWLPGCTGDRFLDRVRAILTAWPADLVFIDPLAGFADGDLVKPEVVQRFCRAGLGALAVEHRCALWVCHHVPKPNANRDPAKMGAYDFQYAGTGNADVAANWPRAVLTLQPLARGEFLLRAAKRRPPWADDSGRQLWEIGLRHTSSGTWESFDADPETARTGRPPAPDPETYRAAVLSLVGQAGPMPKTAFADRVRAKITESRDGARAVIELLIADRSIATWRGVGRGGCTMIGLPSQAPKGVE
jgi:hypothetical protein